MSRASAAALALFLLAACGGGSGSGGDENLTPTIASIAPRGGPLAGGTDVVILGAGLAPGVLVRFGAIPAASVAWVSLGELHVRAPAHAVGAVDVSVQNPSGRTFTFPGGFTYALPPIAVVPATLRAPVGTAVAVDGSLSSDPSLLGVTWQWTLDSAPPASGAALSGATSSVAAFTPDVAGTYTVSLVVANPGGASAPATAVVQTITSASKVPDSGQASCWDDTGRIPCPAVGAAGFGQDGQYVVRPPALAADVATVADAVTGLVWQRIGDAQKHNWYEAAGVFDPVYNPTPAMDVCGGLSLGGHADWRLPTRRELYTLLRLDAGAALALADVTAFPDVHVGFDAYYWTTTIAPSSSIPWAVDFQAGRATFGYGSRSSGLWVRCVRGASWGASSFVDQGDGTVRDDGTGLVWEQSPPVIARSWSGALARCESLALAGGGWRLPSAKEMDAFIEGTRFFLPAADGTLFPATQIDRYWTSTTTAALPSHAYVGDMAYGWLDGPMDKGTSYFVRCVR